MIIGMAISCFFRHYFFPKTTFDFQQLTKRKKLPLWGGKNSRLFVTHRDMIPGDWELFFRSLDFREFYRVAKLEKACIFAQTYLMQVLIW